MVRESENVDERILSVKKIVRMNERMMVKMKV